MLQIEGVISSMLVVTERRRCRVNLLLEKEGCIVTLHINPLMSTVDTSSKLVNCFSIDSVV